MSDRHLTAISQVRDCHQPGIELSSGRLSRTSSDRRTSPDRRPCSDRRRCSPWDRPRVSQAGLSGRSRAAHGLC